MQLQRVQRMGPLPAPASEHHRQAPLLVLFTLSSDDHASRSHLCDASCNVSHRLDLFQVVFLYLWMALVLFSMLFRQSVRCVQQLARLSCDILLAVPSRLFDRI